MFHPFGIFFTIERKRERESKVRGWNERMGKDRNSPFNGVEWRIKERERGNENETLPLLFYSSLFGEGELKSERGDI